MTESSAEECEAEIDDEESDVELWYRNSKSPHESSSSPTSKASKPSKISSTSKTIKKTPKVQNAKLTDSNKKSPLAKKKGRGRPATVKYRASL